MLALRFSTKYMYDDTYGLICKHLQYLFFDLEMPKENKENHMGSSYQLRRLSVQKENFSELARRRKSHSNINPVPSKRSKLSLPAIEPECIDKTPEKRVNV